jgi:hypothetical protein
MTFAITMITFGLILTFLYGIGVFALCVHAGESLVSAATEASGWWVAFSASYFFGHLAFTLT